MSATTLLASAFALGAALGYLTQRTHFCTMGAVADIVNMGDWTRMRQWLLAIAIAVLGSAVLNGIGLIDLDKSLYRGSTLPWLSHLIGGLLFGAGMVLASGCGLRTLTRIGAGNLKSLIVALVLAVTALMTLRGILALPRLHGLDPVALFLPDGNDLGALLRSFDLPGNANLLAALFISLPLLAFTLAARDFRKRENLLAGTSVGLAVIAGWLLSGYFGYRAEDPETLQEAFLATASGRMESLAFVAGQAYTLDLLLLWSDTQRSLSFGGALALGAIAGSWLWAIRNRQFRWEGFRDATDLGRHLAGGALMGFGGVTAMGCSIGQGISGVSTLALGSLLSLVAIIAGAAAMLAWDAHCLQEA